MLTQLRTISSERRSHLALLGAGVLTLIILGVWVSTLGTRLSGSSTLSASNEESANTFSASQSFQDRLNELGASFDAFSESAGILTGGEETPAETQTHTQVQEEFYADPSAVPAE